MAGHDAGAEVACPRCGQVVLQKAMIPIVGEGGNGVRYLCIACARAVIVPPHVPNGTSPDGTAAEGTAADGTAADGTAAHGTAADRPAEGQDDARSAASTEVPVE